MKHGSRRSARRERASGESWSSSSSAKASAAEAPLFVLTDNALGAPFGDVDDAFALAALMKAGAPIAAVASVFGNTFERWAYRDNQALAERCGSRAPVLHGASAWWARRTEAAEFLLASPEPVRVLCIGPMTDVALALRREPAVQEKIRELIFVATNHRLPLPAWKIFDFNQWKDPKAMRRVLASGMPLTCVPLDVARTMRVTHEAIRRLPGPLGEYLFERSARWFQRARRLKGVSSVPLWDLAAAMYVLRPACFETSETTIELTRLGQAVFGGIGNRPVRLVTGFDPALVWREFEALCR